MTRWLIVGLCVFASVAGLAMDSGSSLSGVAAIAEQSQRERAERQAEVYEMLADRVEAGELTNATDLGKETESAIAASSIGIGESLQSSASEILPSGDIENRKAVSAWYRAVAAGFRRVADE